MVNEPKKRSITGKLVANVLTEREDDFTCNVTYVANRSIKDLCRIRAAKGSKYTAAEYESMCNDLEETAKEEMYSGSTVELGFMNNSLTAVTDVVTAKVNSQLTPLVKPSLKRYAVIASLIN